MMGAAILPMSGSGHGAVIAAGPPTPYIMPRSRVIVHRSTLNGVSYKLLLQLPASVGTAGKRFPLIVTLDADYSFPIAAAHLEHLSERSAQIPEVVLLSIGYDGDYSDRDLYRLNRTRDYTPVHVPVGGYGPRFQAHSGRATAFASIIRNEILPLVERDYPIDNGNRTLVGHSYGGLFAAWLLQQQPDLFRRYLMVSPSLWYADRYLIRTERDPSYIIPDKDVLAYLAVGSWEEQPEQDRLMVTDLREFSELLKARSGSRLKVRSRIFEDETHASIFPAAFSSGVRALFGEM
jgi:predicted alpha/beta superfamily hydrolase